MHGKGTLYFTGGAKIYEGEFFEDKYHGFGHLYNI